jgi:mannose-6-phosphate isomerase
MLRIITSTSSPSTLNFELLTLNLEPALCARLDFPSTMSEIYPYILTPAYKDYIWGGSRLPKIYDRDLPEGIYAESWELSDRPEGPSTISNGPLAGTSLTQLISQHGTRITGSSTDGSGMPLLIKLIDSAQNLSVQVHPNDSNADLTGGEPKTEMWYVIDAEPDAKIYAGLVKGTTKQQFEDAIASNTLESCLNTFAAKKGDVYFIPGGRVHAIGSGCLLLELQQNSNTTYRVYDWGRVDAAGKSRQLHIEEALKVIDWDDDESPLQKGVTDGNVCSLLKTDWFELKRIELTGTMKMDVDGSTFHSLFSEEGSFIVSSPTGDIECARGQTCLVPAAMTDWSLTSEAARILCSTL